MGRATYGIARSDVGNAFGARFTNSGYSLTVGNLTPGASYRLVVFTKSPTTNDFSGSATVNVNVSSSSPAAGPTPTDPNAHPPADPNPPIPGGGGTTPNANTRVAVNRSGLTFASTDNGNLRSGAQSVTVSFTNGGSTWSVASDAPWLTIRRPPGRARERSASRWRRHVCAGQIRTGTLTVTAPGVANSPLTVPVSFTAIGSPTQPIGLVDTPADHATGVVGSIPVTGWAIDDIGVTSVTLWRDPVAGEPASSSNGKVFIGNAGPVDGARPDVDATYAAPFDYQAGWGYLLLTNMLPNQGNGTFTLYVYATDVEGHTVLLGSRTITCDNAHATKPFGSIDTPDQGGTVSGAGYINFGWALTPQPNMIPTDGSTITVYVDGVAIGHPVYNQSRSDIATLFPGRANTNGAIGYLQFDTRTLANGVHTIAWGVTDNAGNSEGIGSRYFTVLNGASSSILSSATVTNAVSLFEAPVREAAPSAGESVGQPVSALEPVPVNDQPTYVQNGFEPGTPLEYVDREVEGGSTRVGPRSSASYASPSGRRPRMRGTATRATW